MALRTIKARFESTCPDCKRVIAVGASVAKSDRDQVWRCPECAAVHQEIFTVCGPDRDRNGRPIPFISVAAIEAHRERQREIFKKHPVTKRWINCPSIVALHKEN